MFVMNDILNEFQVCLFHLILMIEGIFIFIFIFIHEMLYVPSYVELLSMVFDVRFHHVH